MKKSKILTKDEALQILSDIIRDQVKDVNNETSIEAIELIIEAMALMCEMQGWYAPKKIEIDKPMSDDWWHVSWIAKLSSEKMVRFYEICKELYPQVEALS